MDKEMNLEALNANLRMVDKQGEMNLEKLRWEDSAVAEKIEKMGELLKDEQFAKTFLAVDSAEEAVALFAGRGVEISEDEVGALAKQIATLSQKLVQNGGELDEDDLERIVGGAWSGEDAVTGAGVGLLVGGVIGGIICPGLGSIVGIVGGAGIGTAIGGVVSSIGKFFSKWF